VRRLLEVIDRFLGGQPDGESRAEAGAEGTVGAK
jgi:hypothetical protein